MSRDDERTERESASRERGERGGPTGPPCPFCQAAMFKRHCKYVCPQHGVVVDCSDPFL